MLVFAYQMAKNNRKIHKHVLGKATQILWSNCMLAGGADVHSPQRPILSQDKPWIYLFFCFFLSLFPFPLSTAPVGSCLTTS